jgi:hypothetical protein
LEDDSDDEDEEDIEAYRDSLIRLKVRMPLLIAIVLMFKKHPNLEYKMFPDLMIEIKTFNVTFLGR